MAQLRDAQTSELIAEGAPLEMVLLADKLGRAEVMFDDVGEAFDPDAVLDAARRNEQGLKRAASDARGDERARIAEAHANARAELSVAGELVGQATGRLDQARARVER